MDTCKKCSDTKNLKQCRQCLELLCPYHLKQRLCPKAGDKSVPDHQP